MRKLSTRPDHKIFSLVLLVVFISYTAGAESASPALAIVESFEEVYLTVDIDDQAERIEPLLNEAERYRDNNPDEAEAWFASALIRSAYAQTQGLRALRLARTSRDEFERAIELDSSALGGYSQAFLGRLYFTLPSWPISFGNDDKAEELLMEALSINSETAANNLYFGLYLITQDRYQEAQDYLNRAKAAAPRPEFPNWDAVLQRDVEGALTRVRSELQH
ncbi:MAG: hypothetical protein MI746_10195 [Pseudomonadales bacterium]|nr:hypothetical protein [Pseudomonadales bacterium]